MKNRIFGVLILLCLSFAYAGCGSEDEVPPRLHMRETEFILPKATKLTIEEREVLQKLKDEYQQAVGEK